MLSAILSADCLVLFSYPSALREEWLECISFSDSFSSAEATLAKSFLVLSAVLAASLLSPFVSVFPRVLFTFCFNASATLLSLESPPLWLLSFTFEADPTISESDFSRSFVLPLNEPPLVAPLSLATALVSERFETSHESSLLFRFPLNLRRFAYTSPELSFPDENSEVFSSAFSLLEEASFNAMAWAAPRELDRGLFSG